MGEFSVLVTVFQHHMLISCWLFLSHFLSEFYGSRHFGNLEASSFCTYKAQPHTIFLELVMDFTSKPRQAV